MRSAWEAIRREALVMRKVLATCCAEFAAVLLGVAVLAPGVAAGADEEATMTMTIRSTAFEHEGKIPRRCTCEGADVSPPLAWSGLPTGARTLALIVDDPDAPDPARPKMTWVHWVLYDLPASAEGLPEDVAPAALPPGTREGRNDWKRTGWGGPCPPIGRHRYFFKLYALDTTFGELGQPTKAELEKVMRGHVLAEAVLMGTYRKGD